MKTIINEGTKGFLFKNGKFVRMLDAGKYTTFGSSRIYLASVSPSQIVIRYPDKSGTKLLDPRLFLKDVSFRAQVTELIANDGELTLHFADGNLLEVLPAGRYYFWKGDYNHTFLRISLSRTEFPEDFPEYLFGSPALLPYVYTVTVSQKQKALLFIDKKFDRVLEAGVHRFVNGLKPVEAKLVDTCLLREEIVGQELLTADKVTLRISCTCSYRIADIVKAVTETDDYKAQLHTAFQLALREFVEEKRLDDLLACKGELSAYLLETMKQKGEALYLDIEEAAVKDIILPGEIRDIMNTVLVAEKRAQANVITRREEVASTRSLLNTARLMEENATLYRLKEMEYIERICEHVGNITLNGTSDLLSQLTSALCGKKKKD